MRGLSTKCVSTRLRSLRARALAVGERVFQLVAVDGCPVDSPGIRGRYSTVADALAAARRFGASVAAVREWAVLSDGVRVHCNTVEWLLEWHRVASLASPPTAEAPGAPIRPPARSAWRSGASGASPARVTVQS